MRRLFPLTFALILAACGPNPDPDAPYAYVHIASPTQATGQAILDSLDTALTPAARSRIQIRSFVSGTTPDVEVRIAGTCADNTTTITEIRQAAAQRGVSKVECRDAS